MKKTLLMMMVGVVAGCAPMAREVAPSQDAQRKPVAVADGGAGGGAKAMKRLYPASRQEAVEEVLHGEKVADPFRWLEDEKSSEVQAWVKAQDEYARGALAGLPPREGLVRRFRELLFVEAVSLPRMRGERLFYSRTHPGKDKAILYWREGNGPEHVLLDPNDWEPQGKVSLGYWMPSWDGRKVVFQFKPNAADMAILRVADVDTGEWSTVDVIDGGRYASPSWTPDGAGFYYECLDMDPALKTDERPGHTDVRYHALGTDPKADPVLFPATKDPTTLLGQALSEDGKYLFVYVNRGWSQTDLYLKRLGGKGEKKEAFQLLAQAKDTRYEAAAWKDELYLLTDEGAPRQRIFKVSAAHPERKNWKEIVPEDASASLESASIVGGHLVLNYLRNAASELKVATLDGKVVRTVALPGLGVASGMSGLPNRDDAYFSFSSLVTPQQVYKTSIREGGMSLWGKVELPIDPSPYTVEQVWYPSRDGTKVSLFLVHRKDLKQDGENPVLLYGYGGFNVSMTPAFSATLYPWLEAGGVYALANLRGGGEYGSEWHEAGRGKYKQNVFDDFIAAGEYLVRERYTRPGKLAIQGGSNGGLLVGAVMVQKPELFGAVVCGVPLLDMLRYHLYGSGRTWIGEYGTPENPEDFKVLRAYSPYHAVKSGVRYPPLLMMSADHDDRVDPFHARKFVAALQGVGQAEKAWLRVEANAGHGGADQLSKLVESRADALAFLMDTFGMRPGSALGSLVHSNPSDLSAKPGAGAP